jgi:hypothetical protein
LEIGKAGEGEDGADDPRDAARGAETGGEEFRAAVAEKDGGHAVGAGADDEVKEAGDDGAGRPDEIGIGMGGDGGICDDGHPGGNVPGLIGDEREKKKCSKPKEGEADDFADRLILLLLCHVREDINRKRRVFKPRGASPPGSVGTARSDSGATSHAEGAGTTPVDDEIGTVSMKRTVAACSRDKKTG